MGINLDIDIKNCSLNKFGNKRPNPTDSQSILKRLFISRLKRRILFHQHTFDSMLQSQPCLQVFGASAQARRRQSPVRPLAVALCSVRSLAGAFCSPCEVRWSAGSHASVRCQRARGASVRSLTKWTFRHVLSKLSLCITGFSSAPKQLWVYMLVIVTSVLSMTLYTALTRKLIARTATQEAI